MRAGLCVLEPDQRTVLKNSAGGTSPATAALKSRLTALKLALILLEMSLIFHALERDMGKEYHNVSLFFDKPFSSPVKDPLKWN